MLTTATKLRASLSAPVDAASLAIFRILFGSLMAAAMIRFLAKGWVKSLYLDPQFHFPWVAWIVPWPSPWMHVHVAALALLAIGIAIGFYYRICAALFCVGFTYLEFIDRTTYLNHYYLVSLFSALLIFMPANRACSLDALLKTPPHAQTVPFWTVWILRFQIAIVFIFAGLAKLNTDWLFEAQPMRIWLMARSDLPFIGSWLAETWVAYAASWFGAVYDLSVPFLLLANRTRARGYAAVIFFHILTAILFPIGMFPWLMIASTTIFFPPSWPRRFIAPGPATSPGPDTRLSPAAVSLLLLYCLAQILVPTRAWLYPLQGAWDGRGFNFSWRVMVIEKTGFANFYLGDPTTGAHRPISSALYITPRQNAMMAQDPYMIRQFAAFLEEQLNAKEAGCEIRVESFMTVNGRPAKGWMGLLRGVRSTSGKEERRRADLSESEPNSGPDCVLTCSSVAGFEG